MIHFLSETNETIKKSKIQEKKSSIEKKEFAVITMELIKNSKERYKKEKIELPNTSGTEMTLKILEPHPFEQTFNGLISQNNLHGGDVSRASFQKRTLSDRNDNVENNAEKNSKNLSFLHKVVNTSSSNDGQSTSDSIYYSEDYYSI